MADTDIDEDVVEYEGVHYNDGDPRPLAALDDDAKDKALAWFWQSGIDWECLLQPGYCDHDHYKEMAAERGIVIDEFDWSIGNYNGSDYVTFSGCINVPKWVAWRMSWYEHRAALHGPHRTRAFKGLAGKWRAHFPDTTPPAWLLALETLIQNDAEAMTARVTKGGRFDSAMSVEYEWDMHDIDDWVMSEGVLAGATWEELCEIVDAADLDKEMKADCEEIADDACGSQQADYEWHSSMECLEETAEANEWRFDECGNFLHS